MIFKKPLKLLGFSRNRTELVSRGVSAITPNSLGQGPLNTPGLSNEDDTEVMSVTDSTIAQSAISTRRTWYSGNLLRSDLRP